jgi:hypothetical protein
MKPVAKQQGATDDLSEAITNAMRGMHELREENAALRNEIASLRASNDELEHRGALLRTEIGCLKSQLEIERTELRHYHSLSNEIITRLDVVGRTVDDVVQRAQQEVYRQRKEHPRGDLPELEIPPFLTQSICPDAAAEPKADARGLTNGRPIEAGAFAKSA